MSATCFSKCCRPLQAGGSSSEGQPGKQKESSKRSRGLQRECFEECWRSMPESPPEHPNMDQASLQHRSRRPPGAAPGAEPKHVTCFAPFVRLLGGSWGALGPLLASSWGPLGASWASLGASWGALGLHVGLRGAPWGGLGSILTAPFENREILENH